MDDTRIINMLVGQLPESAVGLVSTLIDQVRNLYSENMNLRDAVRTLSDRNYGLQHRCNQAENVEGRVEVVTLSSSTPDNPSSYIIRHPSSMHTNEIELVKALRTATGCGLKEARDVGKGWRIGVIRLDHYYTIPADIQAHFAVIDKRAWA